MSTILSTPVSTPPPPASSNEARRNFRLGVWNGAIYHLAEGFIDTGTVIPVMLSRLTASNALIGLASSLDGLGWLLPQLFVAPWTSRRARQMPIYRAAAFVRAVALGLLAILAWALRDQPQSLIVVFFGCYTVFALGAGLGAVSFMEVVGRTVPPGRLGAFFSQRLFWGGLFGAVAGLAVREILRGESTATAFAILFSLATVLVAIAYALFTAIREPEHEPAPIAGGAKALVVEGIERLRTDPLFRRLLAARATLSVWFTASPFIVLFAVRELGGGARAAGTFLLARLAGFILSNLLWERISRREGNRAIMRIAAPSRDGSPAPRS